MENYDLTKKRPQVFLFGNGLVYNKKWGEVIDDLKDESEENFLKDTDVPYPLQSSVLFHKENTKKYKKYDTYFNNTDDNQVHYHYKESYNLLESVADINFDAYLTTNYTYELENIFKFDYLKRKNKVYYAYTTQKEKDKKRIIHTYNSFKYKQMEKNVWHIHGEVRNKSSLIFTHDDYCRLIGDLKKVNDIVANNYEKKKDNFTINSWFDYFIVADIYILGFGFSFSEIDLWWLLCRRLCEKSGYGRIYFFEPKYKSQNDKYEVMKKFAINVEHLGFSDEKKEISNEDYEKFYFKSLKEIKKLMEENQNEKENFKFYDIAVYGNNIIAGKYYGFCINC